MLFRRLFLCALLVGLCAGLAYSLAQRWQVVPLIAAAETFESARAPETAPPPHEHAPGAVAHDHSHEHEHDATAWAPADGFERTFWTVIANVLGATGFALLMLPALAWWDRQRGGNAASWRNGLLWGAAGWYCFFAWPALGLPPELPGEAAAGLHLRQAWWLLAVACAACGLAAMAFARGPWRAVGLPVMALPFIVGAPHLEGSPFAGYASEAAAQMVLLKPQFVVATALASAVQWLVIGAVAGAVVARWLRPLLAAPGAHTTGTPRPAAQHAA